MPSASDIAAKMLGSHEHTNHAALTEYLKNGGERLDPATTAWCAAFVNASLNQAGLRGTGSELARSYLDWGKPTNDPKIGDVAVFSRGDPSGPYGHVGFYQGRDAQGNILVLGGNQGDRVSVMPYPANRLLGFRTPDGTSPFEGGAAAIPYTPQGGVLSTSPQGITLSSNPVAQMPGWAGSATAANIPPPAPVAAPDAAPAAAAASSGTNPLTNQSAMDKLSPGLDMIAKGIANKPAAGPSDLNTIAPMSSYGGNIGGGSSNSAQLLASLLQNARRNYGISLAGMPQ